MNCTQCGEPVSDGAVFCTACGGKINKGTAQNVSNSAPSGVVTFFKIVLSALLGVFLLVITHVLLLVVAFRSDNLPGAVANADIGIVLEQLGLSEKIAENINLSSALDEIIDVDDINEFLKRDTVSEEIGNVAEKYIEAITVGDYDYYLTSKEAVRFLKAVSADIQDEFDHKLTNKDYEAATGFLKKDFDLEQYSVGSLLANSVVDDAIPYVLLSMYALIIVGALCALLVIDIFLLHRNKIRAAFLNIGIVLALAGLICLVASLALIFFPDMFSGSNLYTVTRFAKGLTPTLLRAGLICFAAGIVNLVIFFIIRAIRKNHPTRSVKNRMVWRVIGLITNLTILTVCGVSVFLCLRNVPEASAYQQTDNTESSADEIAPEPVSSASLAETSAPVSSAISVPAASVSASVPAPLAVWSVNASSTLESQKNSTGEVYTYFSDNAFDNNVGTVWCEGVSDAGVGEWLQADFSSEVTLTEFYIKNGHWRTAEMLEKNGRIKSLRVEFSDGTYEDLMLTDPITQNFALMTLSNGEKVTFSMEHKTSSVTLTILSTYDGAEWEDTCVTDIVFYGYSSL